MSLTDLDKPFDPLAFAAGALGESDPDDPDADTGTHFFAVELPSGAVAEVRTAEEAALLSSRVVDYKHQYGLDNVADLAEVDRCLQFELTIHRFQVWQGRGVDYNDREVDEKLLTEKSEQLSRELRQIKKTLGIDKVYRDRVSGRGSLQEYINNLLARVHRFGLSRNKISERSRDLGMELLSLIDTHKNCSTDKELRMTRTRMEDIFEWIDTVYRDEILEIDADYRESDQRLWILVDS